MITDSPFIVEEKGLIEINQGRRFPIKKSYLLFFIFIGCYFRLFFLPFSTLSFSLQVISILLLLFILTANTGLFIDKNVRIKFYIGAFGYKIGTEKSIMIFLFWF